MLHKLIAESTGASDVQAGRPTLVGFTRKVNSMLHNDIAGVMPTRSPIATVFGLRYDLLSQDGNTWMDAQLNHKVGTGKFPFGDTGLTAPTAAMVKGDHFIVNNYVFQVIKDGDYSLIADTKAAFSATLKGDLRCVADAIPHGDQEDGTEVVQDSRFILNQWRCEVGSRKVKLPVTIESLQDLDAMGFDGQELCKDMLAAAIAHDVNTDIILKVITVAQKHDALDLSSLDRYRVGRTLISNACEFAAAIKNTTTLDASFVLASANVAYAIRGSGQVDNDGMIRGTGMKLITDKAAADFDYMVVGVKRGVLDGGAGSHSPAAMVAPVYYSPFIADDEAGSYLVTRDVDNMQPVVGMVARYAVSAPPVSAHMGVAAPVHFGDWTDVANSSEFAHACEVVLPTDVVLVNTLDTVDPVEPVETIEPVEPVAVEDNDTTETAEQ